MNAKHSNRFGVSTTSLLMLVLMFFSFPASGADHICQLSLEIPDTVSAPHSQLTIPIHLDNPCSNIAAFIIWIHSNRPPEVLKFSIHPEFLMDTTYWQCLEYSGPDCIDSLYVPSDSNWDFIHVDTFQNMEGAFDTAGTLISGWEYVQTQSISGNGTDLLIRGFANISPGPMVPPILPQQGGTLVNILVDVFEDNEPFSDSTVQLDIYTEFRAYFDFFPVSQICPVWLPVQIEDTNCYVCNFWQIDTTQNPPDTLGCLDWQQTSTPPCDSVDITLDTIFVLDTNIVCVYNGSVRILPPYLCGDFNNDGVAGNILDLTYLVDWMFRGGPPGIYPVALDINCDNSNNIIDLTTLVDFIFRGGPPPCSLPACF